MTKNTYTHFVEVKFITFLYRYKINNFNTMLKPSHSSEISLYFQKLFRDNFRYYIRPRFDKKIFYNRTWIYDLELMKIGFLNQRMLQKIIKITILSYLKRFSSYDEKFSTNESFTRNFPGKMFYDNNIIMNGSSIVINSP